jgi:hypothetical protein
MRVRVLSVPQAEKSARRATNVEHRFLESEEYWDSPTQYQTHLFLSTECAFTYSTISETTMRWEDRAALPPSDARLCHFEYRRRLTWGAPRTEVV